MMNRFIRSIVVVVGIILVTALAIDVIWRAPKVTKPENTLSVFVSFFPLADIASRVGGQYVIVRNMLPSGAEPHDFEPTPRDLIDLGKADLFLYNGAHFEPWVDKWASGSFARPRYTLPLVDELTRRGVSPIDKNGAIDPHLWVSPAIFIREVEVVRDALMDIDPVHALVYQENAERFLESLRDLDTHYHTVLKDCEKEDIIVSHDAFGYLARDYGFSLIPIAGLSPDEEPSPKVLAEIANVARKKGLAYVFFETAVSPKLSQTIAREIGGETLALNPVESLTPEGVRSGEDYLSTMFMNLNNLQKALVCH